jgi:hypothetical protein
MRDGCGGFADGPWWQGPRLQEAPERHQSLPGERHQAELPQAGTALAAPGLGPLCQSAPGLKAPPAPGDLYRHGAPRAIAGLRQAQCSGGLATLVRWGGEPCEGPDVLRRLPMPPGQKCQDNYPRPLAPNPA